MSAWARREEGERRRKGWFSMPPGTPCRDGELVSFR